MQPVRRRLLAAAAAAPFGMVLPLARAGTEPRSAPAPLAARFDVRHVSKRPSARVRTESWYLFRGTDRIAVLRGDQEDLWHRDAGGSVRLERIHRTEREIVDYAAGELLARGLQADWIAVGTLVDERLLSRMQRLDAAATRYRGRVGEDVLELTWDARARLPLALRRRGPGGDELQLQRVEWRSAPRAGWPVPGAASDDFRRLDAADFGDMENDAFVRKVRAHEIAAGWKRPHEH